MKKSIFPIIFVIVSIAWLYIGYSHDYGSPFKKHDYKTIKVVKILKNKYSEANTEIVFGNVQTTRYFIYKDGTLEKVNLKTYMSFNSGDTLTWKEKIKL